MATVWERAQKSCELVRTVSRALGERESSGMVDAAEDGCGRENNPRC